MLSAKAKSTSPILLLILAAGTGQRCATKPKQFLPMGKDSVLGLAISSFLPLFNDSTFKPKAIQVVIGADQEKHYAQVLTNIISSDNFPIDTILKPCIGGDSRQASAFLGLQALKLNYADFDDARVIVHDAARPNVSLDVINRLCAMPHDMGGIPFIELEDSLAKITNAKEDYTDIEYAPRHEFINIQTPQIFPAQGLYKAHQKANEQQLKFTDDGSLFKHFGNKIAAIKGDKSQKKITTMQDYNDMQTTPMGLEHTKTDWQLGLGVDLHKLKEGKGFPICGVDVSCNYSTEAHSDGDVVLHALCDAILGVCSGGDIGQHFPDTDPKYKNAASKIFVHDLLTLCAQKNIAIRHVDISIIAEVPKVAPHNKQMLTSISNLTGLAPKNINIKATTSEKCGAIGKKQAIAAFVIVLAQKITTKDELLTEIDAKNFKRLTAKIKQITNILSAPEEFTNYCHAKN